MAEKTTRREFLKTTAGAAATLSALGHVRAAGANERIAIGLIGCGSRMRGAIMPSINRYAGAENVEITAVCDPWRTAREEAAAMCLDWFGRAPRQYSSYKQLLDEGEVDAVAIASCDHLHTTHLKAAAEAGKDAYCEKPLAKDFEALKAAYDAVNITFSEVAVSMSGGWIVLSGNPVTVNLLEWNNGKSIELGRKDLEPGKVTQIRLMVTDAEVVVDGETHSVTIPSADQTGLKLITNFDLVAGSTYELVIDFDAHSSIVTTGPPFDPTGYELKPTLRVVEKALTGSISGTVLNPADGPVAVALQGNMEVTTTPVDPVDGSFRLSYLMPGTYDIRIEDTEGLKYTQSDIVVTAGEDNAVGAVTLE